MFDWSVNFLAVAVAAVANLVINTVWYLPAAFGTRWGALTGRNPAAAPNPTNYVVAIVGSLISAFVLAVLAKSIGTTSATDGLFLGVLVWAGFLATTTAVGGLFEGRPWALWAITSGSGVLAFAAMGAIIGAMG